VECTGSVAVIATVKLSPREVTGQSTQLNQTKGKKAVPKTPSFKKLGESSRLAN